MIPFGCGLLLFLVAAACERANQKKPAATVSLVFASPALTLDPQRHSEDQTRAILANFFEGLVELDRNLEIRPKLATDWSNPSETVWRFRLRPGVRFHDGHILTAEDVRHTIERAKRIDRSSVEPDIRAIVEVRTVDPLTIEFVTDRPRPLLLARLATAPILSRFTDDAEIARPVGTGPFVMREATAAGATQPPRPAAFAYLRAQRFDDYWGQKPGYEKLEIRCVAGDEELAATAATAATVISPLPSGGLDALKTEKGRYRAVRSPTVTIGFLICRLRPMSNGKPSPFADRRVRRALSLAIDRQSLVERAFGDEAVPAWQLVMPGVHGFDPGLEHPSADPARARQLLKEAGFAAGFDAKLLVSPRSLPAGNEIARQLAFLGVRLEVKGSPWPERLTELEGGNAHLVLGFWSTISGDASGLFEPVLHTRGGPGGFGSENYSGYSSTELDHDIQAASVEMNPSLRAQSLIRAMRRALEDLPLVPLYAPIWTYGIREGAELSPRLDAAVLGADVVLVPPGS
jgi:peptide/nickel transport system substrate-binding protein